MPLRITRSLETLPAAAPRDPALAQNAALPLQPQPPVPIQPAQVTWSQRVRRFINRNNNYIAIALSILTSVLLHKSGNIESIYARVIILERYDPRSAFWIMVLFRCKFLMVGVLFFGIEIQKISDWLALPQYPAPITFQRRVSLFFNNPLIANPLALLFEVSLVQFINSNFFYRPMDFVMASRKIQMMFQPGPITDLLTPYFIIGMFYVGFLATSKAIKKIANKLF